MKKVMGIMALSCLAAVLFSGCTTYYRDSGADGLYRPQVAPGAPYYTEFEIEKDMCSAQGEAAVLLGMFQLAENKRCQSIYNPHLSFFSILTDFFSPTNRAVTNAQNIALYNACEKSNADQLLGVTFDYVITDYFFYAKVNCVAKGFPAKVKAVKMIDKKPIILNKWQKIEYVAPHENPVVSNAPVPKSIFDKFN